MIRVLPTYVVQYKDIGRVGPCAFSQEDLDKYFPGAYAAEITEHQARVLIEKWNSLGQNLYCYSLSFDPPR